jgi:hypothetical protein
LLRAYNAGASNASLLLNLPPELLGIIARKMGKRARHMCGKLCQAYGAPGTMLQLTTDDDGGFRRCSANITTPSLSIVKSQPTPYVSIIVCWRHPHAITRLALGRTVILDGYACGTVASLPNLQELSCGGIDPTIGGECIYPLLSLTSMQTLAAINHTHSIAAFAPNLRSLLIEGSQRPTLPSADVGTWSALALLSGLQHLDAPLGACHLRAPSSFCAAIEDLTALTHLGLQRCWWQADDVASVEMTEALTQALGGLPLLSSVSLRGIFSVLGPSLGAALQALKPTSLHLEESRAYTEGLPAINLAACLPGISAMPLLRHLSLSGPDVFLKAQLRTPMRSEGFSCLTSLELGDVRVNDVCKACALLERLPGLTSLSLQVINTLAGQQYPLQTLQLAGALSRHTRLQHLEMRADLHGILPFLAFLPALTSLGLSFSPCMDLQRADLQVVRSLRSLRKLSLRACNIHYSQRWQLAGIVRSLPLLEQVQLHSGEWTEGEVALLVPPPKALQRVVLGTPASAAAACAKLDAVSRLRNWGVDVFVT